MPKIFVRVANAQNSVKNDEGVRFEPYKLYEVEETDRIKDCVAHNLLEKVPAKEAKQRRGGQAAEESIETPAATSLEATGGKK